MEIIGKIFNDFCYRSLVKDMLIDVIRENQYEFISL